MHDDLSKLLANMRDDQIDALTGIALRIATAGAEGFTGKICFEANMNQGIIGDMHVQRGEVVKIGKRRSVRSAGI